MPAMVLRTLRTILWQVWHDILKIPKKKSLEISKIRIFSSFSCNSSSGCPLEILDLRTRYKFNCFGSMCSKCRCSWHFCGPSLDRAAQGNRSCGPYYGITVQYFLTEKPLYKVFFTTKDSWRETREKKNAGKRAVKDRVARKAANMHKWSTIFTF